MAALTVDIPLSRVVARQPQFVRLHRLLEIFEPFGQPPLVLAVAASLALCDRNRRKAAALVALASLGSGLAADGIKLLVARARPYHFDLNGSALQSFQGFLPGLDAGASLRSMPSGHTAVAAGLALALARFFPGGAWLFACLALMVAAQRIEAGAHYLSDTLCGAAVASAVCGLVFRRPARGEGGLHADDAASPLAGGSACPPAEAREPTAARVWPKERGQESTKASDAREVSGKWHTEGHAEPRTAFARRSSEIRSLTVVVPVRDERDNLVVLHAELAAAAARLPICQILFVDDGSRDGSDRVLDGLQARDPLVERLALPKALGQACALRAGCLHARGDAVAWLDGDLQNDPADLAAMLKKLDEGFDLVCGWRSSRRDHWLDRRLPSLLGNALIRRVTGSAMRDMGCTLKVMRAPLARALPLFDGMHRFVPVLAEALGARICEVPVRHRPRVAGRSKYGLARTAQVLRDLVLVRSHAVALRRQTEADRQLGALASLRAASHGAGRAA
jgi:membrane-associated phospholipid phosphatase